MLAEEDFKKVGEQVFAAEVRKVGQSMLQKRQRHGQPMVGIEKGCVWQRTSAPRTDRQIYANQMLDQLADGQVVFNFVQDFDKRQLPVE